MPYNNGGVIVGDMFLARPLSREEDSSFAGISDDPDFPDGALILPLGGKEEEIEEIAQLYGESDYTVSRLKQAFMCGRFEQDSDAYLDAVLAFVLGELGIGLGPGQNIHDTPPVALQGEIYQKCLRYGLDVEWRPVPNEYYYALTEEFLSLLLKYANEKIYDDIRNFRLTPFVLRRSGLDELARDEERAGDLLRVEHGCTHSDHILDGVAEKLRLLTLELGTEIAGSDIPESDE